MTLDVIDCGSHTSGFKLLRYFSLTSFLNYLNKFYEANMILEISAEFSDSDLYDKFTEFLSRECVNGTFMCSEMILDMSRFS